MAQDLNRVVLIGNVTRDIELRKTSSGTSTCAFSIAVNRPKAQDGTQNADFPQIVAWRKTAEVCAQWLHKGSKVAIEGRLQTRSYDKDGHKVYVTEVVADTVQFLDPRTAAGGPVATGEVTPDGFAQVEDSELPF